MMEFGPSRRQDVRLGIMPRVDRLIREVARRASSDGEAVESMLPVLEYIAGRVPRVYLRLAELVREVDDSSTSVVVANEYLGRYVEQAATPMELAEVWSKRAEIYAIQQEPAKELHALAEVALATGSVEEMGRMANRINNKLQFLGEKKGEVLHAFGLREMIASVAEHMHRRLQSLSGTDCSRLAWLMLNLGDEQRARDVARRGVERDPQNDHCRRLVARLDA